MLKVYFLVCYGSNAWGWVAGIMSGYNHFGQRSVLRKGGRGGLDIVEMILETCANGALKTHIMYECKLNSTQIGYYVSFLERHKLLESKIDLTNSSRTMYKITKMGKKYITAYKQLQEILK
jgi:predicted transcriptional regulator